MMEGENAKEVREEWASFIYKVRDVYKKILEVESVAKILKN